MLFYPRRESKYLAKARWLVAAKACNKALHPSPPWPSILSMI